MAWSLIAGSCSTGVLAWDLVSRVRFYRRIGVALVNRLGGFSGSSTMLAQVRAAEAAGSRERGST